jgi:hypothetical protein
LKYRMWGRDYHIRQNEGNFPFRIKQGKLPFKAPFLLMEKITSIYPNQCGFYTYVFLTRSGTLFANDSFMKVSLSNSVFALF